MYQAWSGSNDRVLKMLLSASLKMKSNESSLDERKGPSSLSPPTPHFLSTFIPQWF